MFYRSLFPVAALAALIVASTASAQGVARTLPPPGSQPESIAFSTVIEAGGGGGLVAFDNGAFSRRLQSFRAYTDAGEQRVYTTEAFPTGGATLDGHIGLIFGGRWMVGASGQTLTFPEVRSINGAGKPHDSYELSGGGGGGDLGIAFTATSNSVIYAFASGGLYGYSLDYTNRQDDSIPFFEGTPVAPNTTARYTGSAARLGVGIGLVCPLTVWGSGDTRTAPTLTARLTWGSMISRPRWVDADGVEVNNGGLTPAYNGVSLSLQIGGLVGFR